MHYFWCYTNYTFLLEASWFVCNKFWPNKKNCYIRYKLHHHSRIWTFWYFNVGKKIVYSLKSCTLCNCSAWYSTMHTVHCTAHHSHDVCAGKQKHQLFSSLIKLTCGVVDVVSHTHIHELEFALHFGWFVIMNKKLELKKHHSPEFQRKLFVCGEHDMNFKEIIPIKLKLVL